MTSRRSQDLKGDHPLSEGVPPAWASGWGEDRFGVFADVDLRGVGLRMRWIPPGRFQMGSPKDEAGRSENEPQPFEVVIEPGFWLAATPTTQAQWMAVMDENPSRFKSADRPVECVNFQDISEFLLRLSEIIPSFEGRLPEEWEWEYACRAGTSTATYAGNLDLIAKSNAPVLDGIGWYAGNAAAEFELSEGVNLNVFSADRERAIGGLLAGTHPVGRKRPNDFGIYDMLGNIEDYCGTFYLSDLDQTFDSSLRDQSSAGVWSRVVRGGSWYDSARSLRAAQRYGIHPDNKYDDLGFRLSRGPITVVGGKG